MELQNWIDRGFELIMIYGPKILFALIIWIVGSWVIKMLLKGIQKTMERGNYDVSLKKFLVNLINWALKIILIVVVLGRKSVV